MNILLVDDDAIIIEDIRRGVDWAKLGITQVRGALDAAAAKEILSAGPVDIVVCDIEMPQESGLELLRWYRERDLDGKFLLLTSYGKFEYASEAVRLRAEEYLLKPFNVKTMEMALQKVIQDRKRELEQAQANALGQWMVSNIREAHLSIWSQLLSGEPKAGYRKLMERLRGTGLEIDTAAQYRLVISRATNIDEDLDSYGHRLVSFILTNMHSDTFGGTPDNENVLCYQHPGCYILASVCRREPDETLEKKCLQLQRHLSRVLTSTVTFCVMEPCPITQLSQAYQRGIRLLEQCAAFYGEVFFEDQTRQYLRERAPVLQMALMADYLQARNKKDFMAYLKKTLDARIQSGVLDKRMLESIHREVQQAIYAHLAQRGIQISLLLNDRVSERIAGKADQSAVDLLRCEDYLLDKVFHYEQELEHSKGLIEKVNDYIHTHYAENIGRNEIGAAFYLVPEYLAKLYKKKTGVNLKDYINNYRMEQAKKLLRSSDRSISDIAMAVGFDNLSYFSTLFKKCTGMTPVEFRRQPER